MRSVGVTCSSAPRFMMKCSRSTPGAKGGSLRRVRLSVAPHKTVKTRYRSVVGRAVRKWNYHILLTETAHAPTTAILSHRNLPVKRHPRRRQLARPRQPPKPLALRYLRQNLLRQEGNALLRAKDRRANRGLG